MATNQFVDLTFCSACGNHYDELDISRLILVSGHRVYEYLCDDCLPIIKLYSKGESMMPSVNGDASIAAKIKQRRLQMLIHSHIYYILDQNIISDSQWSKWAVELETLQKEYPEVASTVCYADDFKDWGGSTGAFLPLDDPWVINKARYLLRIKGIIY